MNRWKTISAPCAFSSWARWASCAPVPKTCFSLPFTKCVILSNSTMRRSNISARSPRLKAPRSLTTLSLIILRSIRCLSKISYSTLMSDKKRLRSLRTKNTKRARSSHSRIYLKYWQEMTTRWLRRRANRVFSKQCQAVQWNQRKTNKRL